MLWIPVRRNRNDRAGQSGCKIHPGRFFPTDADGNTIEADNIYAMCYAEQESAFCAGMAAALETQTNKVAVVNGIAYPSNVDYQYGFEWCQICQ